MHITSYKDDSIGGDSNGDGSTTPSFSDFNGAVQVNDNAVVAQISYIAAASAIYPIDTSVAATGALTAASTQLRGDSNGPFTAPGVTKACGTVTVSPWKVGSSFTGVSAPFDIPNCDNSPTPVDKFVATRTAAQQQVAQRRIDCNNGFQDACDAIANAFGCLGAAIQLAASQSPIPVTFDNPTETVDTIGQTMAETADIAIRAVEVERPPAFSLAVAIKVLGVVHLYNALTDAYESCSP